MRRAEQNENDQYSAVIILSPIVVEFEMSQSVGRHNKFYTFESTCFSLARSIALAAMKNYLRISHKALKLFVLPMQSNILHRLLDYEFHFD